MQNAGTIWRRIYSLNLKDHEKNSIYYNNIWKMNKIENLKNSTMQNVKFNHE